MKKWISVIFAVLLCVLPVSAAAVQDGVPGEVTTSYITGWPQAPDTYSETAVLMEAETGTVLYGKGMHDLRYPASITKLMTLLLAVENSTMDEQVTFTEHSLRNMAEGTNIGMQVGEVMSMEDCLHALIINSANEVANQIAEHVAGTEEAFIERMNQRAAQIGCTNTNFVNASGMPDENHYSTAYDFALIMREGLKNPAFRELVSAVSYTIPATNLSGERNLHTHLPLVAKESPYYYDGCIGGKTGLTVAAQNTLVAAAKKKGVACIVVTMRAPELSQNSADAAALWNYAYDSFEMLDMGAGLAVVPRGTAAEQIKTVQEEKEGKILENYYYEGYLVGSAEAVKAPEAQVPSQAPASEETSEKTEVAARQNTQQTAEEPETASGLTGVLLIIMAVMFVILAVLIALLVRKNRRS